MRPRWCAVPVVLIMIALAACGPEKPAETSPPQTQTAALELAKTFAPLVRLGKDEEYKPIDTTTFIAKSALRWNREKCPDEEIDEDPTAAKLGDPAAYRARKTQGKTACLGKEDKEYNTTERTRPFDNEELGEEGYFLDADNDIHDDGSASAPAYVEYVQGTDANAGRTAYVFWFFYPYNRWTNPVGGLGGNHEGDWERITVVTDTSGRPDGVVFSQHLVKCRVEWSKVAGSDGHPVVYSAVGSHGSYPIGDAKYRMDDPVLGKVRPLDDETSTKGEAWQTWDTLREVEQEPWWGYAGGWGEVGAPVDAKKLDKSQTGPAGPSPFKHEQLVREAFTHEACPEPVSKEEPAPTPKPTPKPKPTPTKDPRGKLAAISRLEEYLHALGRKDAPAACKIAASDIRALCRMALPIAFGDMSKREQSVLKTVTIDPDKVRKVSKDRYEVPPKALSGKTTLDGDLVMIYRDDNWYLTE